MISKKFCVWVGLVMITAVLTTCQTETSIEDPTQATAEALATALFASVESPTDVQSLQTAIDTAQVIWNANNIQKYSIEVRHRRPNWDTQIVVLTVADGVVLESNHTCYPERTCMKHDVEPQELVVENMFDVARQVISFSDLNPEFNFNESHGFPTYISYDDASWVLDSFEIISSGE